MHAMHAMHAISSPAASSDWSGFRRAALGTLVHDITTAAADATPTPMLTTELHA